MMISEDNIKRIQQYFSDKPVKRAFVFGSYGRDDAEYYSDVDILVEPDDTDTKDIGFQKMKSDLEDQLRKRVNLVSSDAVSKNILPFINADKQLVYEK
jgi:predicted nucleotidyltransferase